jgi:CRP-like cAMP-binding protein
MQGTAIEVPTVELIRNVRLFQAFSDAELQAILNRGEIVERESHANIVIEGELSWGLYIILDGVVGILKNNTLSGEVYDVGQIGAGGFFGEMSLIDEHPRSATVRALLPTRLLHISKENFMGLLNGNAGMKTSFYENCIKDLVKRLRELDENYVVSQYQLWKTAIKGEFGPGEDRFSSASIGEKGKVA